MKVHVEVTQEDIDQGCPYDPYGDKGGGCMVYRALMRATEGALTGLGVHSHGANWDVGYVMWDDQLHVVRSIDDFDDRKPVAPFAFDIEVTA